jgi:hypothetical protein
MDFIYYTPLIALFILINAVGYAKYVQLKQKIREEQEAEELGENQESEPITV